MTSATQQASHGLVHVKREEGGVAVVTFAKAETMNSLDPKTMGHVRHSILGLLEDDAVRAIVLTGSGKAFCAGANVKEMQEAAANGRATQWVLDTTAELHPLLLDLHATGKPVVAAVNGAAAGGGLGLALVADCRVGSPDARFAAGYFGIGLSPDGGSTWLLPRLVGEQRTRRFFFGNEVIAADEAKALGLLDELVPGDRLVARAVEVARTWGAWAMRSREGTKRLLEAQSTTSFADQLETERGLIAAAAGTTDFQEGTTAFTEKRKPRFS